MGNNLQLVLKSHFHQKHPLGFGSTGTVYYVEEKSTKQKYAMKVISKQKILKKCPKVLKGILNELHILSLLNSDFIVNMNCAFQDQKQLYLVIDYMRGGDLRQNLKERKKFSEDQAKFFISNIIIGLDYLHSKGIIHKDLKPENLIFDFQNYLRITDFGLAEILQSNEVVGSYPYMAPEVYFKEIHDQRVDFFALGIITFELITGKRPLQWLDIKEEKSNFFINQIQFSQTQFPGISSECIDFINQLIRFDQNQRLGHNGIDEIKNHAWLSELEWDQLEKKNVTATYKIEEEMFYFIDLENEENLDFNFQEMHESYRHLNINQIQNLFISYKFVPRNKNLKNNANQGIQCSNKQNSSQKNMINSPKQYIKTKI